MMRTKSLALAVAVAVAMIAIASCKQKAPEKAAPEPTSKSAPPAAVIRDGRITLETQAEKRLGIATVVVSMQPTPRTRTVGGDVIPSSGKSLIVVAPIAGRLTGDLHAGQTLRRGDAVLRLTPVATVDRDLRAQSDRSESVASSRLIAAEARLARTEKLLADGAASTRQVEEARAERDVAKAEVDAAKSKQQMVERAPLEADVAVTLRAPDDGVVQKVSTTSQSLVPAGAPLFELVGTGSLWVKATVFVGDLRAIRADASARVKPLTAANAGANAIDVVEALPVNGPPTSDPASSSFDLYFALPKQSDFRPGERVAITLTYRGEEKGLVIPSSAIVRDVNGVAWVYEVTGDHVFERRRVEVIDVGSGSAATTHVASGWMKEGVTRIVTDGSSELFGFELGNGK